MAKCVWIPISHLWLNNMLEITSNIHTNKKIKAREFDSLYMIRTSKTSSVMRRSTVVFILSCLVILFLPWTQNIRSRGYVTTLSPDKRPQNIHSVIPGQIKKWYIREGDFVKAGDTIVKIAEVKSEYFDPELIQRTKDQIVSKEGTMEGYNQKIGSLESQYESLLKTKNLKINQAHNYIKQARLKILSDSIDVTAATSNYEIAERQLERTENLFNDGLKSLTDLETKKLKVQETKAKMISAENKLLTSRNMLLNATVELSSIKMQYNDKLSKVESDKFSAISDKYDAEGTVSKMKNTLSNYEFRQTQHFILAPQDGYITQALITGVGETVKEGESLVSIMPADYDLAVEMYVRPVNLPLIQKGQKVRFMFDGWPSIVFSGWPNASYGTFGGKVVAIDNFISDNGKYRILVAEDKEEEHDWPVGLRVGSGADGMALLKNVSIWYELWRNMNGFPPDYYETEPEHNTSKAKTKEKR